MRKVKHIFLLVVAVLLVAGCSPAKKVKDIRLTSWEIRDVKPQGFRGLNATIAVGIDNPAMSVTIDRLEGMIHTDEKEFARFENADDSDLTVTEQTYMSKMNNSSASVGTAMSGTPSGGGADELPPPPNVDFLSGGNQDVPF